MHLHNLQQHAFSLYIFLSFLRLSKMPCCSTNGTYKLNSDVVTSQIGALLCDVQCAMLRRQSTSMTFQKARLFQLVLVVVIWRTNWPVRRCTDQVMTVLSPVFSSAHSSFLPERLASGGKKAPDFYCLTDSEAFSPQIGQIVVRLMPCKMPTSCVLNSNRSRPGAR